MLFPAWSATGCASCLSEIKNSLAFLFAVVFNFTLIHYRQTDVKFSYQERFLFSRGGAAGKDFVDLSLWLDARCHFWYETAGRSKMLSAIQNVLWQNKRLQEDTKTIWRKEPIEQKMISSCCPNVKFLAQLYLISWTTESVNSFTFSSSPRNSQTEWGFTDITCSFHLSAESCKITDLSDPRPVSLSINFTWKSFESPSNWFKHTLLSHQRPFLYQNI